MAPIAPVSCLVVFLIHIRILGSSSPDRASGFCCCASLISHHGRSSPSSPMPFGNSCQSSGRGHARNAQVINAMGMIPEGVQGLGARRLSSREGAVIAQDRTRDHDGDFQFPAPERRRSPFSVGRVLAAGSGTSPRHDHAASIVSSLAFGATRGHDRRRRSFCMPCSAYVRSRPLLQNTPLNLRRFVLPRPREG